MAAGSRAVEEDPVTRLGKETKSGLRERKKKQKGFCVRWEPVPRPTVGADAAAQGRRSHRAFRGSVLLGGRGGRCGVRAGKERAVHFVLLKTPAVLKLSAKWACSLVRRLRPAKFLP